MTQNSSRVSAVDPRALDAGAGVRVLFTDRSDGSLGLHVGEDGPGVQRHRRSLEEALGLPARHLLFLDQVHGVEVARAEEHSPVSAETSPEEELAAAPTADAAVTTTGCPLAVMVADCLPVVLTTDRPLVFAVAHAGRRGLLDGVLPRTVAALRAEGAEAITAWIGPAVCGSCYEVPRTMVEESERAMPGIGSRTSWGTAALDLPGAAARQLEGLGASVRLDAHRCTVEGTDLFSHRRAPGEGRLAGVVWYRPEHSPAEPDRPAAASDPESFGTRPTTEES